MATNEKQREALTEELKTKSICRFCLTQGAVDHLSNIYAKDTPVKSLLPLPVEIMSVASIEVFLNDGMPSTVCLKCRLIFDYCYRFKQMCKKAESLLNQVPLLGEWPAALVKPIIPPELLMKTIVTHNVSHSTIVSEVKDKESQQKVQQYSKVLESNSTFKTTTETTTQSKPRRILNSNPSDLPEPPIPTRTKSNKLTITSNLLRKVENDEEISEDDIQSLLTDQVDESSEHENNKDGTTKPPFLTKITNTTKNKPKVLNKYSKRILNKEAAIDLEPRLKQPRVSHDEDGNVSIVTEILDPNEPYETEPDSIKNAEPVQTNIFPCGHCDRTFPLLQLLDIHMINHTRSRLFPCPICDRSFFSKYDLQKHSVVHTGERKYRCTVCPKAFSRPALLHRHEKVHTDMPKHICVFCEKQFLSKNDLEKHVERHNKNRPFKCKVCDKSFAFKQGLERHEVVHSSDQPFPCQYCNKSFSTSSKLARHLVAHAGNRPYPCKFCNKSYLLSHHLTRHLRTHKQSFVMYSCNVCEETFDTCEELVLHSTVHGAATLTCPLCQQNFQDVSSVELHIKEHALAESYPCEFCDLLFLTSKEQVNHVQIAHPQEYATYNDDENNTRNETDDQELDDASEEFLYDETITPDNENLHITKQEKLEETDIDENTQQQENELFIQNDPIYKDEAYFKTDNSVHTMDTETLTNITIDRQEPITKKKPTKRNSEPFVVENTLQRKSPRGAGGGVEVSSVQIVGSTTITRRSIMRNKQNSSEILSPSSTSQIKQSRTVQQSISQFMVKKESENRDYTETSTEPMPRSKGTTMPDMLLDTETSPTADKGVKMQMRLGDKQVRVHKIVVTKGQAAAMAKEGRICIKDGNLILTSKTQK
ncbi:zinc finger protein pita [Eurosta solidaginis]|uniref:zinc finger protein pita n=1 Tax=Eurosta solidaginis TaxID=178769 RepID=UPI0035310360